MTTDVLSGQCPECGRPVGPADNFCQNCRTALGRAQPAWLTGPLPTTPTGAIPIAARHAASPPTGHRQAEPAPPADQQAHRPAAPMPAMAEDNSTRYLCAAAHLDADFAKAAIAEYLVEPVRATPPTPGVDVTAVLSEAVAARARRRLRDIILLVLLTALLLFNPVLFIGWLATALMLMAAGVGRKTSTGRRVVGLVFGLLIFLGTVGTAITIFAVAVLGSLSGLGSGYGQYGGYGGYGNYGSGGALSASVALPLVMTLLLVPAIFGVLVVDAVTVHWLTTDRFRRGAFQRDFRLVASSWERFVRGLGHAPFFAAALRRVAAAEDHAAGPDATVVVHRGYRPFIGGGEPLTMRAVALPLEPADGVVATEPIRTTDLHDHVAAALSALRTASSLSPDRRLEQMSATEMVFAPADLLVAHVGSELFPRPDQRPAPVVPPGLARQIAEWPREWARYFRCYRVESWNRELASSCYFTVGTDQKMLYLEWTHCVLRPVEQRFRDIDRIVPFGRGPLARSFVAMLLLPTTVIRRFRTAVHQFLPMRQRIGEIVPDRYGAGANVRELAADHRQQAYFQDSDVVRYLRLIDRALVRGIGDYIEKRGYSVVEFERAASSVTNNFATVNGGTFVGSTIGAGQVTVNAAGQTASTTGVPG